MAVFESLWQGARPRYKKPRLNMKYGIILTGGEPRIQAELAELAEQKGWDGVFTWDGIAVGEMETYDPWVLMAAMAMRTQRVRLGPLITPPSRRRPWKLARETMTLDRLSGGRLILPVGMGVLDDGAFGNVGEATDRRVRALRIDETLAILEGLWSGEPFGFSGQEYRFQPMTFRPTPIQQPRIPIWVVGLWGSPKSMQRVLRYDGFLANVRASDGGRGELTPELLSEIRQWIGEQRSLEGFDLIAEGTSQSAAEVEAWRQAGATWWIEADWNTFDPAATRARIESGPPV